MSIAPHVVRFGAALLDFVYPPHCPVCDVWQPPDDREPVCRVCINSLLATISPRCDRCSAPLKAPSSLGSSCPNCVSWRGIHFDRALVLADFSGVAGDAIHSLKFSGIKKIGPFLGRQMAGHPDLRAGLAALDLRIPVPLHAARQRERGYNQAKEIALGLSESLGIPLDDGCVRRCRPTRQQARLDASERAANTDGAFETMRSPLGSPARIGLVDDVLTTGATLSACASALSRATGAHVIGLAVASPFR